MANLFGFNAAEHPEQDFSAIPEGVYPVMAIASEMKPTKNGNGEMLVFTFEVLEGQFKGRKLWSRLNLKNANKTAVEIAQRELAQICNAVGIPTPTSSEELHNRPFHATVKVEIDDRRREINAIKKYTPLGSIQPPASPTAFSSQPGAQAPAPATSAATPPAQPWSAPAPAQAAPWAKA